MEKSYFVSGVLFVLLSIILGALGSHAIKPLLPESSFYGYTVATHYLGFQGLGLVVMGILSNQFDLHIFIYYGLLWGTLLFSGSILLLTLGKLLEWRVGFLGPITPIGGLLLIAGWIVLLKQLIQS